MTFVVVGVTGATLYVASKRVRDTYQHLFEDQFQQQLRFFSSNRIAQLEEVARKCETVAKSVRVTAAMEAALEESDGDTIYDALAIELEELIKSREKPLAALRLQQDMVMRQRPPKDQRDPK